MKAAVLGTQVLSVVESSALDELPRPRGLHAAGILARGKQGWVILTVGNNPRGSEEY